MAIHAGTKRKKLLICTCAAEHEARATAAAYVTAVKRHYDALRLLEQFPQNVPSSTNPDDCTATPITAPPLGEEKATKPSGQMGLPATAASPVSNRSTVDPFLLHCREQNVARDSLNAVAMAEARFIKTRSHGQLSLAGTVEISVAPPGETPKSFLFRDVRLSPAAHSISPSTADPGPSVRPRTLRPLSTVSPEVPRSTVKCDNMPVMPVMSVSAVGKAVPWWDRVEQEDISQSELAHMGSAKNSLSGSMLSIFPIKEERTETLLREGSVFCVLPGTAREKGLMKFSRVERVLVQRFRKMGYKYPYLPENFVRSAEEHRMEWVEKAIITHLVNTTKGSKFCDFDRAKQLLKVWVVGRNIHLDRVEYISKSGRRMCYSIQVPDGQGNTIKKPYPPTTNEVA
ncbi:uncharacterized protein LOC142492937 [Ascaphus truei]|uniref:uncharacterized protein LOC142492937 n=1 Tax=Ascaphus truei TaxID=8439 RepID=UPI003F59A309